MCALLLGGSRGDRTCVRGDRCPLLRPGVHRTCPMTAPTSATAAYLKYDPYSDQNVFTSASTFVTSPVTAEVTEAGTATETETGATGVVTTSAMCFLLGGGVGRISSPQVCMSFFWMCCPAFLHPGGCFIENCVTRHGSRGDEAGAVTVAPGPGGFRDSTRIEGRGEAAERPRGEAKPLILKGEEGRGCSMSPHATPPQVTDLVTYQPGANAALQHWGWARGACGASLLAHSRANGQSIGAHAGGTRGGYEVRPGCLTMPEMTIQIMGVYTDR